MNWSGETPLQKFTAALTSAGKKHKSVGAEWEAQCPAHEDKRASLRFREADDVGSKLLVNCHAGCTWGQICDALGLPKNALFPPKEPDQDRPPARWQTRPANTAPTRQVEAVADEPDPTEEPPMPPEPAWVSSGAAKKGKSGGPAPIVAEYIYTDEAGAPLMRVTRHKPKDFRRWRPDPAKPGGWISGGTGEIRRVVYRLPEVRAAIARGETIYIAEGEKDVESLGQLGVVATCNEGGAGTRQSPKWLPSHTECLKGVAKVVIFPDNDKHHAGEEHAAAIADSLAAAEIPWQVVKVPPISNGDTPLKDITDWIGGFGEFDKENYRRTRADLEKLVANASEWTPPAAHDSKARTEDGKPSGATPIDIEPVPLPERPPPPAFPLDVLPATLRSFVLELAEELQVPVDMPAMLALSALALTVAKKARVRPWGNWYEPLCLWVLTVSAPGTRKSAVFERVLEAVVEYERSRRGQLQAAIKTYESDRRVAEKWVKKCERGAGEAATEDKRKEWKEKLVLAIKALEDLVPVTSPRFFTSDTTMEALADLLKDHGGRFGIFGPEARKMMAIIVGKYDSKGSTADFELLLKGHAGEDGRIDRVNKGETFIPRATITLGLMTQPTLLQKLKAADDGSGLAARFAYVYPDHKLPSARLVRPRKMSDGVHEGFKATLTKLLDWSPREEAVLVLSDDAEAELETYAKSVNDRLDPGKAFAKDQRLQEWAGKLAGLVARIAAVLHLAERFADEDKVTGGISGTTMRSAKAIGEYLAGHAMRAFDVMEDDDAWAGAHAIYAWLQEKKVKAITENEIMRSGPKKWRRAKPMREALRVLEERGLLFFLGDDRRAFNLAFSVRHLRAVA